MNPLYEISSYQRLKLEREKSLKNKEDTINDILNSSKKNPKFIRLVVYSLNSLEAMLTHPNREIRENSKIIIKLDGISIIHKIAMLNISNEEIMEQIGKILYKLISINDIIDQEISQIFSEKNGHEAIIEILLSKNQSNSSIHYIKILNILCSIPQLIDKLLESGLIESIKLVNDLYSNDINIININFDTMKKITNLKKGRDYLIHKNLIPNILKNIQNCSDKENSNSVINGLYVLDNLSRNDNGKNAIKNENSMLILSEVLDNFYNDEKIIKKGAKIIHRISNENDMKNEIEKIKNCKEKIKSEYNFNTLEELKESLTLISNLMLIEDFVKITCQEYNFKMLIELFDIICNIDLNNKDDEFNKIYIILVKNFIVVFKRIFIIYPECYNEESEKGKICINLFTNINNSIKKNYENIKNIIEKLEKENDIKGMKEQIKNVFKSYFFIYTDLLIQTYNNKKENEKGESNWIELLEYIIGKVITNGKNLFEVEEKANFAASQILKITDETIRKFQKSRENLSNLILDTFDYLKNILNISEYYKTLSNDLKVLLNMIIRNNNEKTKKIKEELIPIIINFMNKKPKFRYPNYINLKILSIYLSNEFINNLLRNPDIKINPNYSLNYVDAINSVMIKGFYESSTVLKVVGINEEEKNEKKEEEEFNEELEIKINNKGNDLLKKLIPIDEFLKQVKIFKNNASSFKFNQSKVEEIISLENNLYYQICTLNIKEFYDLGSNDDLITLKELLKKEISNIESFKIIKSNATIPKYNEICISSNKRIKLELALLKKIEDNGIKNYNETKEIKYIEILKNIISSNIYFIEKSTDNKNLIELLIQLRKNISFLKENEDKLINEKNEGAIENYINSLMKLLLKSLDDQNLCNEIIKTFIIFAKIKPEICDLLIKNGCPRILLQIMDHYQDKNIAYDSLLLLQKITLSNNDNLNIISKQNLLPKLFEIRTNFANNDTIIKITDLIANEIMKLSGQEESTSDIIRKQIEEFYNNLKSDFNNSEIKQKILNNLENINAFTSNKKQISLLLTEEFQNNLNQVIDLTQKEVNISQVIEKLLTNELSILKKIKENISSKDNNKHNDIIDNSIKVIKNKSNYSDTLLLSCKILNDYIKDVELYNKYTNKKIDDTFIDKLFEINEDYIDNSEITKEINNVLCYLALRNNKYAEIIVSKGGLANVLEELKESINSNDNNSKILKLNGLKMLSTLLNDDKNMEVFIKSKGIDLINNIIKNELNINKKEFDDKKEDNLFKTKETINLKDEDDEIFDNIDNENNLIENENTYFVHCLKIINQGINKGRNDFVDEKTIKNIITLGDANYPDKYLFNEISKILINENVNLNGDIENNISLIKLIYDYKSKFYNFENIQNKVKQIEEKINKNIENEKIINKFKIAFDNNEKNKKEIEEINKKLTYLSFISEANGLNTLLNESKDIIIPFYNDIFIIYKNNNNSNVDEGVIISLMILTNYLFENNLIEKEKLNDYLKTIIQIIENLYKSENYIFVNQYNKLIEKILKINGIFQNEESENNYNLHLVQRNDNENILFSEASLKNMKISINNSTNFFEDYLKYKNTQNNKIRKIKEENLDKIISNLNDYYRTNDDNEIKNTLNKKLYDMSIDLINDLEKKDIYEKDKNIINERIKKLLFLIQNILNKDNSNSIIGKNNGKVKELIEKLNDLIKKNNINEQFIRNIPKIISSKIENDEEICVKILDFISEDLINNKDNLEIKNTNLETLSNLSKFQSVLNLIQKNTNLFNLLKEEYSKENIQLELRQSLSVIFNNISKSNYNIESLINSDPDLIKLLFIKVLSHSITTNENNGIIISKIEISTINNIIKDIDNYKSLLNKNIINEEDFKKLLERNLDNEIMNDIKQILKNIEDSNKNKKDENELSNYENQVNMLENNLNELYNKHMEELNKEPKNENNINIEENINNESDIIKSSSNILKNHLSLITMTLLFNNNNNNRIKSLLSMINNNDIQLSVKQILSLIRSNYNEIKNSHDEKLNNKRVIIINKCLEMLNKLSISSDNHKLILEEGLISFNEKIKEENSNETDKNYLEKMLKNEKLNYLLSFSKNSKEIIQNCSNSENSITIIIESPIFDSIINELLNLYENPELLNSNEEIRKIFLYDNIIFSNICNNKKGFERILEKIGGIEKLIDIGKKTGNELLLETIISMYINYMKNNNLNEIDDNFWNDVFIFIDLCFDLKLKSSTLISSIYELISLIYIPKLKKRIDDLKIIDKMNNDFDKFHNSIQFINNIIKCLSIITIDNSEKIKDTVKSGLISKIKVQISNLKLNNNNELIFNLSKLYNILLVNNKENIEEFCNNGITEDIISFLNAFYNKIEKEDENIENKTINYSKGIMKNSINSLEQISTISKANIYLNKKNFDEIINKTLKNENNEVDYILIALHTIGNYHSPKEKNDNISKNILEELYHLLQSFQKKFYSNSDIITNINYISGNIIKKITDKTFIKKYFDLLSESIKIQDWNEKLILSTLKTIFDILIKNVFLIDEIYDDTSPNIFNLLKIYKDNIEIQLLCYNILNCFSKNKVFSYSMVNFGIIEIIKDSINNINFNNDKKTKIQIRKSIFELLNSLSKDEENSKKISDELITILLKELEEEGYNEDSDSKNILNLLSTLLMHKNSFQPFIQFKGLEISKKILKENEENIDLILNIFKILLTIAKTNDEYKIMMKNMNLVDLINEIIKKTGSYEKKIEYEGRSIIFLINNVKIQLEKTEEIDISDIKITNKIKPEVKNFLTNGKQLKIINNRGDIKQMQLSFSQDLLKITAKKIKSNLPPKPKYIIETTQIKQIIKGHGTDAFKKSKGWFRKIPKPEICFSIIGPTTVDGVKAINVQCENEKDVDRWINYMEIVINYFKKTQAIKSTVIIKK